MESGPPPGRERCKAEPSSNENFSVVFGGHGVVTHILAMGEGGAVRGWCEEYSSGRRSPSTRHTPPSPYALSFASVVVQQAG